MTAHQAKPVDIDDLVVKVFEAGDKTGNGRLTYPEYFKV